MKITVVNGTEKLGVTYKLKEIFLSRFESADITEYYLPKDCPSFCVGCAGCFSKGEKYCSAYEYVQAIEQSLLAADLIVMTSPTYVLHTTGAMKNLLDHLGYRWLNHRPAREMFGKRAVIITQCVGAGAKSAAKDIKHSLAWWGVSKINVITGALMNDIIWDNLSDKKKIRLTRKLKAVADRFAKINYKKPAKPNAIVKIKFFICRMMQKSLHKANPEYLDGKYWFEQGWLNKKRPWKIK